MNKIPDKILENLKTAIPDAMNYSRFLVFLATDSNPKYFQVMEQALKEGITCFNQTVEFLLKDILKSLDDTKFKYIMADIWQSHLVKIGKSENPCLDLQLLLQNNQEVLPTLQFNFIYALSKVPHNTLKEVMLTTSQVAECFKPGLGALVKNQGEMTIGLLKNGKQVAVSLAAVMIAYNAFKSIYRWWTGEISGQRCAKIVIDSLVANTSGTFVGWSTSIAAGLMLGPIGMVIGGVVGGVIGFKGAECLADWFTRKMFGLPKDEAVENAFNFLGLKQIATTIDINKKFRELCLKYHPDKGGKAEDFYKLQHSMAIIKFSRGETAL